MTIEIRSAEPRKHARNSLRGGAVVGRGGKGSAQIEPQEQSLSLCRDLRESYSSLKSAQACSVDDLQRCSCRTKVDELIHKERPKRLGEDPSKQALPAQ